MLVAAAIPRRVAQLSIALGVTHFVPRASARPRCRRCHLRYLPASHVLAIVREVGSRVSNALAFHHSYTRNVYKSSTVHVGNHGQLTYGALVGSLGVGGPIVVRTVGNLPLRGSLIISVRPFFSTCHSIVPFLVPRNRRPAHRQLRSTRSQTVFSSAAGYVLYTYYATSYPIF